VIDVDCSELKCLFSRVVRTVVYKANELAIMSFQFISVALYTLFQLGRLPVGFAYYSQRTNGLTFALGISRIILGYFWQLLLKHLHVQLTPCEQ